ncbi:hypothetical protein GOBAR_AA01113 [Gossypium barbadense]|uniref:Piwi domain-containing protein n=1 Tax=Gossypium barbadense TaxID=3634 RepID=A0A2P5YV69_GOSBA|nr:hypothetical protein GOBAR_AA01113 [Gossypium barbadense]
MTETGKNWHKKLPPTLYAYAGANTFNSSCFKVFDKVDDGIIKVALLDFYTSSGKRKPDQIIIFRDGVSESQFNQVLIKLLRLASSLTRSGTLKIVEYHSHICCGPYLLRSFDSFTIRAIYEVCGCFRDIIKPRWGDCSGSTLDTSAFQVEG